MTIKDNILADHKRIMGAATAAEQARLAKEVGELSFKAIKGGINSSAWAIYMSRFADNLDQLKRLCGEDEEFNSQPWSAQCLAYTVSNGVCTINSRHDEADTTPNLGTLNYLDEDQLEGLNF